MLEDMTDAVGLFIFSVVFAMICVVIGTVLSAPFIALGVVGIAATIAVVSIASSIKG